MADNSSPEQLRERLLRALKAKAVLAEKSRLLEQQVADSRRREETHDHVVSELLDRQRESNFMLHRANSVLHRLQETNLALSSEFTELVKELPAPSTPDWENRVAKINELFRRTGELADEVQDEVFRKGSPDEPPIAAPANHHVSPQREDASAAQPADMTHTAESETAEVTKPSEPPLQPEPMETAASHDESLTQSEPIDAEFTSEKHADVQSDSDRQERLDRLFQRLETVEPEVRRPVTLVDLDEGKSRGGPGAFSRLWRKISGRARRERRAAAKRDEQPNIDKAS